MATVARPTVPSEARERIGMHPAELADRIGVTRPMVYLYETKGCQPGLETALKYAEVLGVTLAELNEMLRRVREGSKAS